MLPENEEVVEENGRIRRKAVFSTNEIEQEVSDEEEDGDEDEEDEDEAGEKLIIETPKKKSKKSNQQVKIFSLLF